MAVTEAIVDNIRDSKITNFLKTKGVVRLQDEYGMKLHLWIGKVIDERRISGQEVNDCLYPELMYGYRRLIRFYELKNVRKIKRESDWKDFIERYDCPGLNFNRILETTLGNNDKLKVAAMSTVILSGVIKSVEILIVYNMKIKNKEEEQEAHVYSYLPVAFDLVNKTMTIKVWNREEGDEHNTPTEQLDYVYEKIRKKLPFETRSITIDPQSVLYKMSKALFDDFFKQLPNIEEIIAKKADMSQLAHDLLVGVTLQNAELSSGKMIMNTDVINVEEEMYKLLQQVALYDYLKDNPITTLLKNTDKYISRIRFNDRDNLTASLTSEKGVRCIFDAKTFMCVRNSLDLVESIVAIVVTFVKEKGLLSVKYDASDRQFLNIHILQNRYYSKEDYSRIWELYKKYESEENTITGTVCSEDNIAAM